MLLNPYIISGFEVENILNLRCPECSISFLFYTTAKVFLSIFAGQKHHVNVDRRLKYKGGKDQMSNLCRLCGQTQEMFLGYSQGGCRRGASQTW